MQQVMQHVAEESVVSPDLFADYLSSTPRVDDSPEFQYQRLILELQLLEDLPPENPPAHDEADDKAFAIVHEQLQALRCGGRAAKSEAPMRLRRPEPTARVQTAPEPAVAKSAALPVRAVRAPVVAPTLAAEPNVNVDEILSSLSQLAQAVQQMRELIPRAAASDGRSVAQQVRDTFLPGGMCITPDRMRKGLHYIQGNRGSQERRGSSSSSSIRAAAHEASTPSVLVESNPSAATHSSASTSRPKLGMASFSPVGISPHRLRAAPMSPGAFAGSDPLRLPATPSPAPPLPVMNIPPPVPPPMRYMQQASWPTSSMAMPPPPQRQTPQMPQMAQLLPSPIQNSAAQPPPPPVCGWAATSALPPHCSYAYVPSLPCSFPGQRSVSDVTLSVQSNAANRNELLRRLEQLENIPKPFKDQQQCLMEVERLAGLAKRMRHEATMQRAPPTLAMAGPPTVSMPASVSASKPLPHPPVVAQHLADGSPRVASLLCPSSVPQQARINIREQHKDVASNKNLVNLEDVLGEEPVNLVKRACQRSKELTDEIARLRQVVSPYQASASSSTASASAAN